MHYVLPAKKRISSQPSLLWTYWERTLRESGRRTVLVEADTGDGWTARALNDEVHLLLDSLRHLEKGARIAFCLPNGAPWMALFLALQKLGFAATPLDASMPEPACLEIARYLHCGALFFHGHLHLLETSGREKGTFCCIKVTSGSSGGLPKNVPCRGEHLVADGSNIIRTMGIRPKDRNLAAIPLGHSYGLGNFVMPLILQGTPLVCAGTFVPRQLAEWIQLHRVTVFPCVPAIFRVLASMPGTSRLDPLRLAISAAAPLTAEVAQGFQTRYGLKIHNFYGSSETGGICYDRTGNASLSGRSVGKPLEGVSITLNRGVMRVISSAVAKPGARWRMPDRGEWNEKGELVLRGRADGEVNLGGKKVHPSEVEQALRLVPGVSDAAVWVESQAERAFLQAAVETRLTRAEIQRALSERLPEWKFPRNYLVLEEFPRTRRGKIDVVELRRGTGRQGCLGHS